MLAAYNSVSVFVFTPAHWLQWTMVSISQDVPLKPGKWAGGVAIVHEENLVLQRLSRAAAGRYACVARNELGSDTSPPATLTVMCE